MKKYILVITLLIISFYVGNVYATLSYSASQITYTKNNIEMPLDSALNELYSEANIDILTRLNLTSNKISAEGNYGDRLQSLQKEVSINPGKYIILSIYAETQGNGTNSLRNNPYNQTGIISFDSSKGSCTKLLSKVIQANSTDNVSNNSWKLGVNNFITTYTCDFTSSVNVTVIGNPSTSNNTTASASVYLQTIKLD